ncbi:WD40 repeat domain-containing protein [Kitasatospora sp. NPDC059571]|uniref:WD40 repeat domain-containing protein n=1 Tax=Kitasatospora sp. NPDC059571 TaxID=3346871 RepID=UPI0036BBCD29
MIPKLPLDSPRWDELDGVRVEDVRALLEEMASAVTGSDDGWAETWTYVADGLMQQSTVTNGAYAVVPHLVETAAAAPAGRFTDLWAGIGLMLTADHRPPVPADLEAGFGAALRAAERAAVRELLAGGVPAAACTDLVLGGVALAGHHTGAVLWQFLHPHKADHLLLCPGCESESEIPEFAADPVHPPFEAPEQPRPARARQGENPWSPAAAVLRDDALGEGWEPFLRVARAVAEAGVTPETPGPAVLCLVAGLVAARGTPQWAGTAWARRLMLLTGCFRCEDCEQTWTIADGLAENPDGARPLGDDTPAWTAFDGWDTPAGPASPGRPGEAATALLRDGPVLLAPDGTSRGRISVFADSAPGRAEGVNALAVVARSGRPALVAGAGDAGVVRLWDAAGGRLRHGPLRGHPDRIRSMTALPLPDGDVLLASGDDAGTIALWDPETGRPVVEPVGNWLGAVSGMCGATMPDGRTLLVTATPRGAVRLRDTATGESVGRLNPRGRPIASITAVPIPSGRTLIAAADTSGDVHVWDPAVDDPWEPGAAVQVNARALADAGHRVAVVAAVPFRGRTLLATGDDRNGVVMLWDPATGAAVGDGLSTDTTGLTAMTAAALPDGRTVVVTGSRRGRSLRVWDPAEDTVQRIDLDVAVTCLAAAGPELIVGHDCGVLALPLTSR